MLAKSTSRMISFIACGSCGRSTNRSAPEASAISSSFAPLFVLE